jgi:hypothetical protein
VASIDDLFSDIPEKIRLKKKLKLPAQMSELEVKQDVQSMLAQNNAYFYRPYGSWRSIAYARTSGEEYTALKQVKKIFDPNGILNPGKVCF